MTNSVSGNKKLGMIIKPRGLDIIHKQGTKLSNTELKMLEFHLFIPRGSG